MPFPFQLDKQNSSFLSDFIYALNDLEATDKKQTKAPEITIPDLVNAYNIIKVAIERAAFKAEEVGDVGTVFNKIGAFLKAAEEQQKAQEHDG